MAAVASPLSEFNTLFFTQIDSNGNGYLEDHEVFSAFEILFALKPVGDMRECLESVLPTGVLHRWRSGNGLGLPDWDAVVISLRTAIGHDDFVALASAWSSGLRDKRAVGECLQLGSRSPQEASCSRFGSSPKSVSTCLPYSLPQSPHDAIWTGLESTLSRSQSPQEADNFRFGSRCMPFGVGHVAAPIAHSRPQSALSVSYGRRTSCAATRPSSATSCQVPSSRPRSSARIDTRSKPAVIDDKGMAAAVKKLMIFNKDEAVKERMKEAAMRIRQQKKQHKRRNPDQQQSELEERAASKERQGSKRRPATNSSLAGRMGRKRDARRSKQREQFHNQIFGIRGSVFPQMTLDQLWNLVTSTGGRAAKSLDVTQLLNIYTLARKAGLRAGLTSNNLQRFSETGCYVPAVHSQDVNRADVGYLVKVISADPEKKRDMERLEVGLALFRESGILELPRRAKQAVALSETWKATMTLPDFERLIMLLSKIMATDEEFFIVTFAWAHSGIFEINPVIGRLLLRDVKDSVDDFRCPSGNQDQAMTLHANLPPTANLPAVNTPAFRRPSAVCPVFANVSGSDSLAADVERQLQDVQLVSQSRRQFDQQVSAESYPKESLDDRSAKWCRTVSWEDGANWETDESEVRLRSKDCFAASELDEPMSRLNTEGCELDLGLRDLLLDEINAALAIQAAVRSWLARKRADWYEKMGWEKALARLRKKKIVVEQFRKARAETLHGAVSHTNKMDASSVRQYLEFAQRNRTIANRKELRIRQSDFISWMRRGRFDGKGVSGRVIEHVWMETTVQMKKHLSSRGATRVRCGAKASDVWPGCAGTEKLDVDESVRGHTELSIMLQTLFESLPLGVCTSPLEMCFMIIGQGSSVDTVAHRAVMTSSNEDRRK